MSQNGNQPPKVGYKQPPLHSRYRGGVSGNPKGRPKKNKKNAHQIAALEEGNYETEAVFHREMNRKGTVVTNGKAEKLTARQVIVRKMISMAARGDKDAMKEVQRLDARATRALKASAKAPSLATTPLRDMAPEVREDTLKYFGIGPADQGYWWKLP